MTPTLAWLVLIELARAQDAPAEPPPADAPPAEPPPAEAPPAEPPAAPTEPAAPPPAEPAAPVAPEALPERTAAEPTRGRSRDGDDFMGFGGKTLMLGFGGAYGAYLGGSVAYAVSGEEGIASGVLLGGGAGVVTALVAGPDEPTPGQAILLGTGSTIGAFTGIQTARTLIPVGDEREHERIVLAGTLGSLAGTGTAIAMMSSDPDPNALFRADLGALVGWQMAAGAADLAGLRPQDDRRIRAPMSLAGAYAVGGAVLALDAYTDLAPSTSLYALSLGHGAWVGLWTPYLFTDAPDELQVSGGLRLGLGGGFVAALVLSPIVAPGGRSTALQFAGIAAGNAVGAGIPLAAGVNPDDQQLIIAPMLAGGIAGQLAGAALSPIYEPTANDVAMLTALEMWTIYQAIGWGYYGGFSGAEDSEVVGYALTTGGLGTAASVALVPVLELSPAESTLLAAGAGWGTWYGGWAGHLAGLDPSQHWLLTLALGDVGLAGTAGFVIGPWDPSWTQVGLINGMGLVGGATGALVGVVASPDLDAAAAGSLVGSTGGLVAGAIMARKRGGGAADLALPSLPGPGSHRWQPFAQASPWMSPDGDPGAYVTIGAREVAGREGRGPLAH